MKRVEFGTPEGSGNFNGKAPAALGIVMLLDSPSQQKIILTVPEIEDGLLKGAGVMMQKKDKQHISVLLQRLMKIGVVMHPPGPNNSRKYMLKHWPTITRA